MEEIDELRAKAIASMTSSANPISSAKAKSPDAREEGEVSPHEDAELPNSTVPSDSRVMDEISLAVASKDNLGQSKKPANRFLATNSSMANVQRRASIPRKYSIKTNQIEFKSGNNRTCSWHGKGADDNLVISFSDEDTGSESEEYQHEKHVSSKVSNFGVTQSALPMPSVRVQQRVHRPFSSKANKGVVNRGSVSSIPEVHGNPVTSLTKRNTQTRRSSTATKSSASKEHKHVPNVSDNSLENLRNQIAVRENELKVLNKSMPQSQERDASSYNDHRGLNVMKLDTQTDGIHRSSSLSTIGLPSNVRSVKRQKLDDNSKSKMCSDDQLQALAASTSGMLEISKDKNLMAYHEGDEENFVDTDPSPDRQHEEANKNDLSKSFLKRVVDNESLLQTMPTAVGNLKLPSSHDNYLYSGDISYHQSSKTIPVDSSKSQNRSLCLVQMEPNDDMSLCQNDMLAHRDPGSESPRCTNIPGGADPVHDKAAKTGVGVTLEASNHIFEKHLVHNPDHMLDNNEIESFGMGSMALESLAKLEELHDKELEEAQELRRRCEVEERQSLKAYRKAQRALVDANEKCALLYQKRELFSTQLQALAMGASSSMLPSSWQNHTRPVLDSMKTAPSHSLDLLSNLGHQMPVEGGSLPRIGYEYKGKRSGGVYRKNYGYDFGSDRGRETNVNTSEPRDNSTSNGACAVANHPNLSTDEDEAYIYDNRYVESKFASDKIEGSFKRKMLGVNVERMKLPSTENAQDYRILEANLRSKLVARLGKRTSSKINNTMNAECTLDRRTESASDNEEPSASLVKRLPEGQKMQTSDLEGIEKSGRSNSELAAQSYGNKVSSGDTFHSNIDPKESNAVSMNLCSPSSTTFCSLPSSMLHIASRHPRLILSNSRNGSTETEEKGILFRLPAKKVQEYVPYFLECTNEYNFSFVKSDSMVSHLYDAAIDPFWPFCMFELRGKCNDEECPWQHVKDCISNHPVTFNSVNCGKCSDPHASPYGLCKHIVPIPTYQIGLNLIHVDSHLSWSVLARSNWLYWQRGFCASFSLPFSVQRILPPDAPFLQSGDDPVADDCNRNGLALCFQNQDDTMLDSEQCLEMALVLFEGRVCKADKKKALSLLSRAMEADPNSVVLWVVYLHIYYRKEKGIGKDDMFFHAVQHNQGSYELWLMYINSRMQHGDRLNAYVSALNVFCQRKDSCDTDREYMSACILDIFLQMIDFLCMSNHVDNAIMRIYGLLPSTHSGNSCDKLLSDVHSCLVLSDQCVFWFCCIYLVIYGELPKEIVQQFECEKDLPFGVEWRSPLLTSDKKNRALELMKVSVDNLALNIDVDFHVQDQTGLRSLHFLALSHVRCAAALEGFHYSAELLVKYLKLYPTCIELVLLSARMLEINTADAILRGFEEGIHDWPRESPGVQCLWNQYVEYAIGNRGVEYAEELMSRWFQVFFEGKDPCSENLDDEGDGSNSSSETPSNVMSFGDYPSLREDDAFKYLNLFLYRMLQKNLPDARCAIDKALEHAVPRNYRHIVREHAAFTLLSELSSESSSAESVCSLLNSYLGDFRCSSLLEPLSRRYYQHIKKPKIRQLIDKMLGPVSIDFCMMNAILETCYGPSLLPQKFHEPKDLVDFVESVIDIKPSNYKLALSVYQFTCRNFSHAGIASNAIQFWASSLLVNTILQAVPVAPEHVWLEAANILKNSNDTRTSLRFHQQAVSVYPFSIKLWQSYLDLCQTKGNINVVVEAARERGVKLSQISD